MSGDQDMSEDQEMEDLSEDQEVSYSDGFEELEFTQGQVIKWNYGEEDSTGRQTTPAFVVKRIYSLGRTLSQMFEECMLHYWATTGTLLGAIRHGGLVPWLNTLTLCVMDTDLSTFADCIERLLTNFEIDCLETNFGVRLFHRTESDEYPVIDHGIGLTQFHRYPFCDVYVMAYAEEFDHVCIMDYDSMERQPNMVFHKDNAFERAGNLCAFGDFTIRVPGSAESFLDEYYQDWRSFQWTRDYNHSDAESTPPRGQELPYQPVQDEYISSGSSDDAVVPERPDSSDSAARLERLDSPEMPQLSISPVKYEMVCQKGKPAVPFM